MSWAPTTLAYARTYSDPMVWFDSPDDVVASTMLTPPEKLDILRRWHRQALARAEDATAEERSSLLSLRIARSIRVVTEAAARRNPKTPSSGRSPRARVTRPRPRAATPRRPRGTAEG